MQVLWNGINRKSRIAYDLGSPATPSYSVLASFNAVVSYELDDQGRKPIEGYGYVYTRISIQSSRPKVKANRCVPSQIKSPEFQCRCNDIKRSDNKLRITDGDGYVVVSS